MSQEEVYQVLKRRKSWLTTAKIARLAGISHPAASRAISKLKKNKNSKGLPIILTKILRWKKNRIPLPHHKLRN